VLGATLPFTGCTPWGILILTHVSYWSLVVTVNLADLDFSQIPPTERILIAQALLDSVLFESESNELTPAQLAELRRRADDIDAGRVQCIPWETVRERLWKLV
jgi:putative addiction module component (TIGR02574 family)